MNFVSERTKEILLDRQSTLFYASIIAAMFFLWLHGSRVIYSALDMMMVYCGTFFLMLGPSSIYSIWRRYANTVGTNQN